MYELIISWLLLLLLTPPLIFWPNLSVLGFCFMFITWARVYSRKSSMWSRALPFPCNCSFHLDLDPTNKSCTLLWWLSHNRDKEHPNWHKSLQYDNFYSSLWIHRHYGLDWTSVFYAPSRVNDLSYNFFPKGDYSLFLGKFILVLSKPLLGHFLSAPSKHLQIHFLQLRAL